MLITRRGKVNTIVAGHESPQLNLSIAGAHIDMASPEPSHTLAQRFVVSVMPAFDSNAAGNPMRDARAKPHGQMPIVANWI